MEEVMELEEYRVSVTEVLEILAYLPENMVSNIPEKFMKFLKEHSIPNYSPKFDYSKGLDTIPLSNKTRTLLAMIYRDYMCSEEEKAKYDEILYQNEEIYQRQLRQKYNPDEIFKKNECKEKEELQSVQLVEYKKSKWYERIFQKIFRFFK